MRITSARIRDFRGIRSLDLELGRVTGLIGEDDHLSDGEAQPTSAEPIEIEVTFSDRSEDPWDDRVVGRLNRVRVLQVDDEGRNHVRLRVTSRYDRDAREFAHEWSFLDLNGDALNRVSRRALWVLQEEAGATPEIRDVLEKVISLSRGDSQ